MMRCPIGRAAAIFGFVAVLTLPAIVQAGPSMKSASGGSGSSYYSSPTYVAPSFPVPAYVAPPAAVPARAETNEARLNIRLPENAHLWIEDKEISQTGAVRHLISPPLKPGYEYTYHVKVEWMDNGKEKVRVHDITVHANDVINLDATYWEVAQTKP